jgi:hypothetical protein
MQSQSSDVVTNQANENEEPENYRTSVKEQAKKLNRLNTESELRSLSEINSQKTVKETMDTNKTTTSGENIKVLHANLFLNLINVKF